MNMEQNNPFCDFIQIDYDTYICSACGIRVASDDGPPFLPCSSKMLHTHDVEKIKTFVASISSSSDSDIYCSDETIQHRLSICKTCPMFDRDKSLCRKCGCLLKATRNFLNKLALVDQKCPVGKW